MKPERGRTSDAEINRGFVKKNLRLFERMAENEPQHFADSFFVGFKNTVLPRIVFDELRRCQLPARTRVVTDPQVIAARGRGQNNPVEEIVISYRPRTKKRQETDEHDNPLSEVALPNTEPEKDEKKQQERRAHHHGKRRGKPEKHGQKSGWPFVKPDEKIHGEQ